ncbi:hypothetical protein RRF57_001099 [Xylaria bambusicola]|uniref:Uncharacterized protein n=1 Tax=Xylaria bambusicola TaxID=326684 RepID=A0AAN7UBX6_9PEZI
MLVSKIDPSTSVSKAPQPSPWNILAAMFCAESLPVLIFHAEPMNISTIELKYTGRLPHTLANITLPIPEKAENISGTAVRAATDV